MKLFMKDEWLRALSKAASALRFSAEYDEALSELAKKELRTIAETLSEIESSNAKVLGTCVDSGEEID